MQVKRYPCAVSAALLLSYALCSVALAHQAKVRASLAVSIVAEEIAPSGVPDDPTRYRPIHLDPRCPHLHVVLRNVSDHTVRVWQEGNSWGRFALSLVVTGVDRQPLGKPVTVRCGVGSGGGFGGNAPTFSILTPGEMVMREVELKVPGSNQGTWTYDGFSLPPPGGWNRITMRAVYSVMPDPAARDKEVWTGTVESKPEEYAVSRE